MKTVIRVEHSTGIGIFNAKLRSNSKDKIIYKICPNLVDRHINFPVPYAESLDLCKDKKTWFCAFKSIEQLKNWITDDEITVLLKHRFKIFKLDVNEYQEGEMQIIYTKESIIKSVDISKEFI